MKFTIKESADLLRLINEVEYSFRSQRRQNLVVCRAKLPEAFASGKASILFRNCPQACQLFRAIEAAEDARGRETFNLKIKREEVRMLHAMSDKILSNSIR